MQSAHHPGKGRPKTAGPAVNYPENDGDYLSDSVQKTITKTDTRYGYWLFAFVPGWKKEKRRLEEERHRKEVERRRLLEERRLWLGGLWFKTRVRTLCLY